MGLCHATLATSIQEPNLQHWSLRNGTICVIAPMPDAPLTCLDLWCRAGSANEQPGEEGIAHFLEHMVFKGSTSLGAGEFDLKIEALGGSSNAATGFDDVHFHVLVPPNEAQPALELLLSLVLDPSLQPDAYEIEREVVLEEIAQSHDQPDEQVFQRLLETCWGNHPYGRNILGFEESLKASNPQSMRLFHDRLYQGSNCCLAIAGVIPTEIEKLLINSRLAELKQNGSTDCSPSHSTNLFFKKERREIQVPRLESARLLMAWQMPPASNQEILIGADLATSLLAEGRRSRLVERLREELRIVESIDMDVTVLEQGSLVLLEACCKEDKLDHVEKEIHHLIQGTLDSTPKSKELDRASQLVRNGLCFSLEAPSQVAGLAGSQALWHRPHPLLEPLAQITSWTASRLQQEVFTLLQPELCCTLIATPKEAV